VAERAPDAAYRAVLERARVDPRGIRVGVLGSGGAGRLVTDRSDVDAFVIVDGTVEQARAWQTPHGSPVEIWAVTLDEFREHGLPGTSTAWNRPSFLRARVDLDRLEGDIGRMVERKRRLTADEASALADEALGACLNAAYRALHNLEAGRATEGRLDAIESIGPLLTAAFALEDRVRPFNKWLRIELEDEPLLLPGAAGLLGRVEAIVADPSAGPLRAAIRELVRSARAAGHGSIVDDWAPDVGWLLGDEPFRAGSWSVVGRG
jgi:hypothetical protein